MMNTLFAANIKLKDEIIKRQRKQSSSWRAQRPIRIFVWLCLPVGIFAMHYYVGGLDLFTEIMLVTLIWSLFAVNYFIISCMYAVLQIRKKAEVLELQEDEIVYCYRPYNVGNGVNENGRDQCWKYTETRVRYQDISRIEYHPYYQSVKIYAPFHYTVYRDYRTMSVKRKGVMQDNGEFRLYYEYFENFGDFLQGVSQKSGIPIITVETKQKFMNEKHIK